MSDDLLARVRTAAAVRQQVEESYLSALRAALAAGATVTSVAEAAGLTRQQLRQQLRRLLEPGPGRFRPQVIMAGRRARQVRAQERAAEAQRLRDAGMKVRDIAEKLGVSERTVSRLTVRR